VVHPSGDGAFKKEATVVSEQPALAVPSPESLTLLLYRVSQGDRSAFSQLYQLTSPRLFAIGLRLMRRRDLAEDLLQDVYLRIWRKAGLYRAGCGEPMGWLVILLRRCALDRLRRDPRFVTGGNDAESPAADADPGELPQDWSLQEVSQDLRHCLDRLDANQRRSILLAYYYGLTHEELSTHLEVPLGTVKSWVRRGLLRLKECLAVETEPTGDSRR
jgi:RNA polymerase sigma-70 factor (ECF subfamily)